MTGRLLIYGATGFTGSLIVDEALAFGMRPLLAGRSRVKLHGVTRSNGLEGRVASPDDPAAMVAMLDGVSVVINAAGPFRMTALPLARACLERGVHYLDIGGEVAAIAALAGLDGDAVRRKVMVLPAAGFDVVPTDCMAMWVAERVPGACELAIAFTGLNSISRGSAESVFEQYDELVTVRRAGRLSRVTPGVLERDFDFGHGPIRSTAITWGDVLTAHYSTGIPNITVYYEATAFVRLGLSLSRYMGWLLATPSWKSWLKMSARALPEGPGPSERAHGRARIVVSASDEHGRSAELSLETPEVYSFTATSSIAIADRVLHGDFVPGFQTPARAFGSDFVFSLPGVRRLGAS